MKIITHFYLLMIVCALTGCGDKQKTKQLKLWYDCPARVWEKALPLGNGRIGTMVYGRPFNEYYQLNENTLWSGAPRNGNNLGAVTALPDIRKAIDESNYIKAAQFWRENAQGYYSARYLPIADLFLDMTGIDTVATAFHRELNMNRAISVVNFVSGGVNYLRSSFISYPDQIMVVRVEAGKKGALNFDTHLASLLHFTVSATDDDYLVLKGKAPEYVAHRADESQQVAYADDDKGEGMNFGVHVKIPPEGGTVTKVNGRLNVKNASSAMIILSAATSFNGFDRSPGLQGKDAGVWAMAYPTGNFDADYRSVPRWSCWPMAGGWLAQHLWEHYAFGGDEQFLREKVYPLMKGAAQFMLGWMMKDESAYWVTNPSSSPENTFRYIDRQGKWKVGEISKASTIDMAIIWDLFTNCINASKILNTDTDFRTQLETVRAGLYPKILMWIEVGQADMLNRSVAFFKENTEFSLDDFASQVIGQPEAIRSFKEFREEYQEDRDVKIDEQFEISAPAVKKQAKIFKSVIKLDKNFHIYVHGNRQLIEKGYDDGRDMNYYRIFFKEES